MRMIIFPAVIAFLVIYLGARYYGAARTVAKRPVAIILSAVGVVLAVGFFVSTIFSMSDPRPPSLLSDIFATTMPLALYMALGFLAFDALRVLRLYSGRLGRAKEFAIVCSASLAITAYGIWNVRHISVRDVEIKTQAPGIDLKIAFMSDLHIGGPGITPGKLKRAVAIINAAKPDIVLLGGDIIDRYISDFSSGGYPEILRGLESKHGTFAVLGNHEYYRNDVDSVMRDFSGAGITTLRDEAVGVAGIRLVGADDPASLRFGKRPAPLRAIVRPAIAFNLLLIHNPGRLAEAERAGVGLMLSGHTHAGQIFPVSLIVGMMYDVAYGYGRRGGAQAYVTSGLGTWGTPVRTSGRSEIIFVDIKSE
jgi:predicted MPP superfamily phosphohydrolase